MTAHSSVDEATSRPADVDRHRRRAEVPGESDRLMRLGRFFHSLWGR